MQSGKFVDSETRGTEASRVENGEGQGVKLVHWRRDTCDTREKYHESGDADGESNRIEHEDLQSDAFARGEIDCFRLAPAILGHLVYGDANACAFVYVCVCDQQHRQHRCTSTITSEEIERAICLYFRLVLTNRSGSYFDALRAVHERQLSCRG